MKAFIKKIFSLFGLEVRRKFPIPLSDPVLYNAPENVERFYQDPVLVNQYENEQRQAFYRKIISELSVLMDPFKISTISDVSAGTGKFMAELRQTWTGKDFTGYEYSDAALALSKKNNPGIRFFKADLRTISGDRSDLVICIDSLEHLEYPGEVLDRLLAMSHDNGYLFLVVPDGRVDRFEGHIHFWSPESFRLFLSGKNLRIVSSGVWNEFGEQYALVQRS